MLDRMSPTPPQHSPGVAFSNISNTSINTTRPSFRSCEEVKNADQEYYIIAV